MNAGTLGRPVVAVASTVIALSLLGSSGLPAMEWAKQAAAGGVAVFVSDRVWGDETNMAKWVQSPLSSGAVFALINKAVYGSPDGITTLVLGGGLIDVATSVIKNPLSSALGF